LWIVVSRSLGPRPPVITDFPIVEVLGRTILKDHWGQQSKETPKRIRMKVYTPQELAEHSGSGGKNTLVGIDGKVYDLSGSKKWVNGSHMKRHQAGRDLSREIKAAPHGQEVLENFDMVGALQAVSEEPLQGFRGRVEVFLERFPWFRRHPHPAAVHVPIGLIIVAPVLEFIAIVTGSERTEWAVFCCLALALVTFPAVILTGYFSWWVNYECAESRIITIKRRLAWVSFVLNGTAVLMRGFIVEPLRFTDAAGIIYGIMIVALAGLVAYVGYLGGNLTFPYDYGRSQE